MKVETLAERKRSKKQWLQVIIEKPYVHLSLVLTVLVLIALAIGYLFLFILAVYVFANQVGVPTLQLVTGAISAISAAGSALAAILIWRGNVQARNRVLIDRVLGPIYSEIKRSRELFESWKAKAHEISVGVPFLKQVASDWLYYTLDETLRGNLDSFQRLVQELADRTDLSKNIGSSILIKAASTTFNVQKISTVYLWSSHSWVQGATRGQQGRMPTWELITDAPPLGAPSGYYVHALQIVDFDSKDQYSLPLLNEDKNPINQEEFGRFWDLARKLASQDNTIVEFRQLLGQVIAESSRLEGTFDSDIKRLR